MADIYEYRWQAVDRFQQKHQGSRLAGSRAELETALLGRGYRQIRISRNFVLPHKPNNAQITRLLSQLALLLNAAVPLKQALAMLVQNCRNIQIYQWLNQIIRLLESGYAFSQALEKTGKFLGSQELLLIKMGESSGRLGTLLTHLTQNRSAAEKQAKQVKKMLFYPLIVLTISLLLSLGLLLFIVPQFAELYRSKQEGGRNELPLITELLFSLSDFLQQHGILLLMMLLQAVVFLYFFAKRSRIWATLKIKLLGKLPVFGRLISDARIVFFMQNVALMLNAHIRLDAVLTSFLSQKGSDPVLQKEVAVMLNLIRSGYRFSDGLNPTVFDSEVVQMIDIGESSGNLAKMCGHIGEIYKQKLEHKIDILSQLLEPMLMLLMGLIVGTVIVGLYLPIFDMGSMMQ